MTEYSRMAKGNYKVSGGSVGVSAPSAKIINLPFTPDYVELINYTSALTPTDDGIPFAFWDASVNVTVSAVVYNPTVVEQFNGSSVLATDLVLTNGISVFSAGLSQQYGVAQQVASTTKATNTITTASAHGYSVGDTVIVQGFATTVTNNAMRLLNGIPFTIVTVPTTTTFTINWNMNQSHYTDLSASPAGALVKKVLYPFLYLPEDNVVSAITLGATTTIGTSMYHNFEVGQEIAFRIPSFWGTTQLNSLPDAAIPGSPIYGYVTSVTDNWTFVCSINSSSFTAFNTNPLVTPTVVTPPQVLSVGDVNSGGLITGLNPPSVLYPPPLFPTSTNRVPTINGPAIRGAFVNNTSQGFIIGAGASSNDATAFLGGQDGDVIEWRAYLHDLSIP